MTPNSSALFELTYDLHIWSPRGNRSWSNSYTQRRCRSSKRQTCPENKKIKEKGSLYIVTRALDHPYGTPEKGKKYFYSNRHVHWHLTERKLFLLVVVSQSLNNFQHDKNVSKLSSGKYLSQIIQPKRGSLTWYF